MWIAEEPEELGLKWDRLVLSTHSFPAYYWDKFVKKKVTLSMIFLTFRVCCSRHHFIQRIQY